MVNVNKPVTLKVQIDQPFVRTHLSLKACQLGWCFKKITQYFQNESAKN